MSNRSQCPLSPHIVRHSICKIDILAHTPLYVPPPSHLFSASLCIFSPAYIISHPLYSRHAFFTALCAKQSHCTLNPAHYTSSLIFPIIFILADDWHSLQLTFLLATTELSSLAVNIFSSYSPPPYPQLSLAIHIYSRVCSFV